MVSLTLLVSDVLASFEESVLCRMSLRWDLSDVLPMSGASKVVLVVKNPPANAGDVRGMSSIPGWE